MHNTHTHTHTNTHTPTHTHFLFDSPLSFAECKPITTGLILHIQPIIAGHRSYKYKWELTLRLVNGKLRVDSVNIEVMLSTPMRGIA